MCAEREHFRRPVDLGLSSNRIGASAAALANRSVWPLLARCNLYGNDIPRATARKLKRARRGVQADTG